MLRMDPLKNVPEAELDRAELQSARLRGAKAVKEWQKQHDLGPLRTVAFALIVVCAAVAIFVHTATIVDGWIQWIISVPLSVLIVLAGLVVLKVRKRAPEVYAFLIVVTSVFEGYRLWNGLTKENLPEQLCAIFLIIFGIMDNWILLMRWFRRSRSSSGQS